MISLARLEEHLKHLPPDQVEVILEVRNLVAACCPDAVERLDRKGITYYDARKGGPVKAGICQILFEPEGLQLAFIHGAFMADPHHLLQGKTYPKRYLTLKRFDDVPWEAVSAMIATHAVFDPTGLPENQK